MAISFDKATGVGKIKWARLQLHARQAFNANGQWIIPLENLDGMTKYDVQIFEGFEPQ